MSLEGEARRPPAEAFTLLRKGALYNLISAVIAIIGAVILAASLVSVYASLSASAANLNINLAAVASALISAGVVLLVAVIVYILGWLKFNSAASMLAEYSRESYSIGYTGTRLFIIGLIVELVGLLVIIGGAAGGSIGGVMGGLAIVAIGGIVSFIGMILFAVMLIRLGEVDSSFKTAGILLLIGIILSLIEYTAVIGAILLLVGYYLVYSAAGRTAEKLAAQPGQAPPQTA